jgi:hypothetical protein
MILQVKQPNGTFAYLEERDMLEAMAETGMIFGIPLSAIVEIRKIYLLRRGTIPITKESIIEVLDIVYHQPHCSVCGKQIADGDNCGATNCLTF